MGEYDSTWNRKHRQRRAERVNRETLFDRPPPPSSRREALGARSPVMTIHSARAARQQATTTRRGKGYPPQVVSGEPKPKLKRLETSALVAGYAMSRLNGRLLTALGFRTLAAGYQAFGRALDVPPRSIKGLRDEFDPLHPESGRRGWRGREMLASRAQVHEQLKSVPDEALIELARAILRRDDAATGAALDVLGADVRTPAAAAQRLLTGRRAEEFVLAECPTLLRIERVQLLDRRDHLLGFDFEISDCTSRVVEVKGLCSTAGELLFTEREWSEAMVRRDRYLLVVVAQLDAEPFATVVPNPTDALSDARRIEERVARTHWKTRWPSAA